MTDATPRSGSGAPDAQLTEVTIDREAGEVRLAFDDGTEGALALSELRRTCPCAGCRADRQAGRTPRSGPGGDTVRDASLVGAWGLGITWGDGHSTGIHPFESLREWIATGRPRLTPDSGLGS